jgi:hypothetical protein
MLGYQQKMVFWEILNSREYGISIEDALNLSGSAKDWTSSYHRSIENAISRHNSEHNAEPCAVPKNVLTHVHRLARHEFILFSEVFLRL